ncbi:MAG: acyl-CoA thioesterase [Acidimicrobiales bacterium]
MTTGWGDLVLDDGLDRAADVALLGLQHEGDGRASFELTRPLARFDGKLYGGTAIAVAVALAEVETQRPALWSTVQFVSGETMVGDRLHCTTEVLAAGRSAAQVRVTARVGDREIFSALGAAAHRKPGRLEQAFETMPDVPAPTDAPPFMLPLPEAMRKAAAGMKRNIEMRSAPPLDKSALPTGTLTMWARVPDRSATPAVIAYLADMVPLSIAHASGRAGGGTSIDNTVRFAGASSDEWILLQLDPTVASGGYGHGTAHVWSPDGRLLATASQTASLILFD